MNTNTLAKHYGTLTPRERVPLIQAASARGDEVERDRLTGSAPRLMYSVPDYFGVAEALYEVSSFHLFDLLDTATEYSQALWLSETDDEKLAERMLDCALMYGYLFKVKLAGWRLFCGEQGFDPELSWRLLPGYDTVRRTEQLAAHAAFLPEGAAAYLKRLGDGQLSPPTAEGVAAGLHEAFKDRVEWWG